MGLFTKKQEIDPELKKRLEERGQVGRIAELEEPTVPATEFKPQLPSVIELSKSERMLDNIKTLLERPNVTEADVLLELKKRRPDLLPNIQQAEGEGENAFTIVHNIINETATSPERKKEVQEILEKSPRAVPKKTFLGKVDETIKERVEKVEFIVDLVADKKQSAIESGFQFAAQGVATAWDILFAGVGATAKALAPEFVEKKAQEIATDITQSETAKSVVEIMEAGLIPYMKWRDKNDTNARIGRNLEAALEILSILPTMKGMSGGIQFAKITPKTIIKGIKGIKPKTLAEKVKASRKLKEEFEEKVAKVGIMQAEKETKIAAKKAKWGFAFVEGSFSMTKKAPGHQRNFIKKLVEPVETEATKAGKVERAKVIPILKRKTVPQSFAEKRMTEAVETLAHIVPFVGVSFRKTFQQNYIVIKNAISKSAVKLQIALDKTGFKYEKNELKTALKDTRDKLKNTPTIIGDPGKTMDTMLDGITKIIDDTKNTVGDLFKVRKKFDAWLKEQKIDPYASSTTGFQAPVVSPASLANEAIRDTIYEIFYKSIPEKAKARIGKYALTREKVRNSLIRQYNLLRAKEVVAKKAQDEAATGLGRVVQRVSKLFGAKSEEMRILTMFGLLYGTTFYTTIATIAPTARYVAAGFAVGYGASKLLKQPYYGALIKLVQQLDKKDKKNLSPSEIKDLEFIKNNINSLLGIPAKDKKLF